MLHHIRKAILDNLSGTETSRYAELKPAELDGNVFGYHLKALLSDNYIAKTSHGAYRLTAKGRDYIVRRYEDSASSAHSIFLIVLKVGDKFLMRKRLVQPLLGLSGFVHGEPKYHQDVTSAAQNRLLDKTGLQAKLDIQSSGLIKIFDEQELQSFSHAIILYGQMAEFNPANFIASDATGSNYLVSEAEMSDLQLLPSCHRILDIIQNQQTWFELSYDIG